MWRETLFGFRSAPRWFSDPFRESLHGASGLRVFTSARSSYFKPKIKQTHWGFGRCLPEIWHPAWLLVRIDDDSIIPLLRLSGPQSVLRAGRAGANHGTSSAEGLSWHRAVPEDKHQTQSQKGHQQKELGHLKRSYININMIIQRGSKHQNSCDMSKIGMKATVTKM